MDEQIGPRTEPNRGDRFSAGLPRWARLVIAIGFFAAGEFEGLSAFYNGAQTGDLISLGFGVVGIPAGAVFLYSVLTMPMMRRGAVANLRERQAAMVQPEPPHSGPGSPAQRAGSEGESMGAHGARSISPVKVGVRWVLAALWVTFAMLWWAFEPPRPLWMRLVTGVVACLALARAVRITKARASDQSHVVPD